MVVPVPIDDVEDPRVREFVGLTDAELRRGVEATGGRFGEGIFIVEGVLAINVLLSRTSPSAAATGESGCRNVAAAHVDAPRTPTGWSLRSMLVTDKKLGELDDRRLAATGAVVYVAPQQVLNRVVGFDLHRGAVAAVDRPAAATAAGVMAAASALAMVEQVNDQENLGVIFRNAAALGADGILLSPTTCDPLYRRTVRVSMGHVLTVPFARTSSWPTAVHEAIAAGFTTVALTPSPDATPIEELDLAGQRIAVLLGAEGPGLTSATLEAADMRVRIGMRPGVDSLNVGNAAAIAFHRLFGAGA